MISAAHLTVQLLLALVSLPPAVSSLCPSGTFKEADSGSECRFCEAGKYSTGTGMIYSSACYWCVAAGTYQSGLGASSCELCPAGTYGVMVSATRNSVWHNGYNYAALDKTNPASKKIGCQTSYIALPAGWTIAPNNADSSNVISQYPWGTAVMVLADGASYWTRTGSFLSNGVLLTQSTNGTAKYAVSACSLRILIHQRSSSICSPCGAGRFQTGTGMSTCDLCGNGFYQTGGGMSTCSQCAAGTFQTGAGLTASSCGGQASY